MRRLLATIAVAMTLPACELQESVLAEAQPFVVVESFLTAQSDAVAALHASAGSAALLEPDALLQLIADDSTIVFARVDVERCLAVGYVYDEADFPGGLACYAQPFPDSIGAEPWRVQPGELYRMSVRLPDGERLEGSTRVPQPVDFAIGDDIVGCYLEPYTQAELVWRPAPGAAAYILDVRVFGLAEALAREGIQVEVDDPLTLRGLSIGVADTTIVLPAEIGVFDRFGLDPEIAGALQRGLPPGAWFSIVLAAVDRNYVDWVRGGDFNPSGPIRIPSLFGDAGTGVLGSVTLDYLSGDTDASRLPEGAPPCSM